MVVIAIREGPTSRTQAFPDTARALAHIGPVGTAVMDLEVLVGAVAEQPRAARAEVGKRGRNCSGVALVFAWKCRVAMVCSLSLRGVHRLLPTIPLLRLARTRAIPGSRGPGVPVGAAEDGKPMSV